MPDEGEHFRPYVQVAAFCHAAIQEANGPLSIIRLIDRYMVGGTTPDMPPTRLDLTLVVILKAGFMRGKSEVSIRPIMPSGKEQPTINATVLFEGEERGVQLIAQMGMLVQEEGLYWFDVSVNGDLATRIPLRVIYQRVQVGGPAPAE